MSLITVSLVVCSLQSFGQQGATNSPRQSQNCASARALPPNLPAASSLKLNQVCKPVQPGAGEERKNLKAFHDNATYITFDFPGFPYSGQLSGITADRTVAGWYSDANNVVHGWLRNPDGSAASFDAPSALNTYVGGVNDANVIVGDYIDANGDHGYLRSSNERYVSFDVPGSLGTGGLAINAGGDVAGYYLDANFNYEGLLRERPGTITTFNIPGIYGLPIAINPSRLILGWDEDSNFTAHGFLRYQNGAVTTVDPPAGTGISVGGFSPDGTPLAINSQGRIAGTYWQPLPNNPFGGNEQGFVRHTDGTFETFAAADYEPCCIWTWATGIAPDGTVVGYENDGYNLNRGYIRRRDGTTTLFDEPDAGLSDFQGTFPIAISTDGVILGVYWDSNNVLHGFLRMPQ